MDSLAAVLESSNLKGDDSSSSTPAATHLPLPQSLPTSLTRSYLVCSVPTDAWVQLFSDRIVLGLSQRNAHVGTILSCQVEESLLDYSPDNARYSVNALLGGQRPQDEVLHVLCRRVTDELMSLRSPGDTTPCPPVVLAISLLQNQPGGSDGVASNKGQLDSETFHLIVKVLLDLYKDAIQVAQGTS